MTLPTQRAEPGSFTSRVVEMTFGHRPQLGPQSLLGIVKNDADRMAVP